MIKGHRIFLIALIAIAAIGFFFTGDPSTEPKDSIPLAPATTRSHAYIGDFEKETDKIHAKIRKYCRGAKKISPAQPPVFGKLYGCIGGEAETAKVFVNADPIYGNVINIKVMWNDWFIDIGYGLHADKIEAMEMAMAILDLYVPDQPADQRQELLTTFLSGNIGKVFKYNDLSIEYRYTRGPKIDERLLIIERGK